jgi:hypothetical protein
MVFVVTLIGVLLIARHRSNLAKLIAGTEGRIGEKRASEAAPTSPGDS